MTKLKSPVVVETAFGQYELTEQIGEGGAGRVYGGKDSAGGLVAVKVLTNATTEKRKRFKNEIGFLTGTRHPQIVSVMDSGLASAGAIKGPFYVMRRYDGNLREQMVKKLAPERALLFFSQMLDAVEAAHLLKSTHRDLKPENFLFDASRNSLALADFGIASFAQQDLLTAVETRAEQRLANFMYAAPEQRNRGDLVTSAADIYALGLMLNELFTGHVPHGAGYRTIEAIAKEFGFLDPIVMQMIQQQPEQRPKAVQEVKTAIERYRNDAISRQKLSAINATVVKLGDIDEPLAFDPPQVVGVEWDGQTLKLMLDRAVNDRWIRALRSMGSYSSIMGKEPHAFSFRENVAMVPANEHDAQRVVDYFKAWLPQASRTLRNQLENEARVEEADRKQRLEVERRAEEARLRVNSKLRI